MKLDSNLSYAVVGLGITGISCLEFLGQHGCKRVIGIDGVEDLSKVTNSAKLDDLKQQYPTLELKFGSLTIPSHVDILLLSPGIALHTPEIVQALAAGIEVINDIELFARLVTAPVIAVTGANGKSTVASMVAHLAQHCGVRVGLGGNIGTPALALLAEDYELYVLELSSFQLELLQSLQPIAATILNVTPDHMDRYASFADYRQAKLRIYNNAKTIVVNKHDQYTWPEERCGKVISFGLDAAADFGIINSSLPQISDLDEGRGLDRDRGASVGQRYLANGTEKLLAVKDFPLSGDQNLLNILSALALTTAAGLPLGQCVAASKSFVGLEHRCEVVGDHAGLRWINDSKGTNVGATVAAICGTAAQCGGKIVIILGGESKGADFLPLVAVVKQYCRAAILLGKAQQELFSMLHAVLPCHLAQSMQDCVDLANQIGASQDAVLLSPACASYDMFANFKARGEAFKQAVRSKFASDPTP